MTSFFNTVAIDNNDPYYLYIEKQIRRQLPKELSELLELVGSFGKKPKGSKHKDIDFLLLNDRLGDLGDYLVGKGFEYYKNSNPYCHTIVVQDACEIRRKVDIFESECIDFSYDAFYVPQWYQTKYPYNILPLLY